MKPKKNIDKDLSRKIGLYFVVGLLLILALIYIALEWKTENDNKGYDLGSSPYVEANKNYNSTILLTKAKTTLVSDVKGGKKEFDHDIIIVPFCPVLYPEIEILPYHLADDAPIFPGCENEADQKSCFAKMVQKHIIKNLNYTALAECFPLEGKAFVKFIIEEDGNIGNIKIRVSNPLLEQALREMIRALPKLIPARHEGKAEKVSFMMPIYINYK